MQSEPLNRLFAVVVDLAVIAVVTGLVLAGRLGATEAVWVLAAVAGGAVRAQLRGRRPGGGDPPPSGALAVALLVCPLLGLAFSRRT